MIPEAYFVDFVQELKSRPLTKQQIQHLKTVLCKRHHVANIPTEIDLITHAKQEDLAFLKTKLLSKPTRTLSGVAPIAIMSYPFRCPHGACLYCPSKTVQGVPQSYTGPEPAVRRATRNFFDPYLQVMNRLEQYAVQGHNFDKVDIIIMGGTFPSFQKRYKDNFIKNVFKALNDFSRLFYDGKNFKQEAFKTFFELPGSINDEERATRIHHKLMSVKMNTIATIEAEQEYNDFSSAIKCIGLTIETRSDNGKLLHGLEMLRYGCTRVELGIQSVYNDVLIKIGRAHTAQDNIDSIRILKDLGFKLNFHMMPGLPFVSREEDLAGLKLLFEDERYRPDMLKIYPCMVVRESGLFSLWKAGKFIPMTTVEAADMISEFKRSIPEYCRIMRVQRDIPTYMTRAGVDQTNLRQVLDEVMKKKGIVCKCIRCRESGRLMHHADQEIGVKVTHYKASGGDEFFISAEDGNVLYGFVRMRFPSQPRRQEFTDSSAIIRELHVYGLAQSINDSSLISEGSQGELIAQHRGLGKLLMQKAEQIAKDFNRNKLLVIAGVGVRGYYRKLGYASEGPYMSKMIP